MAAKGAWAQRYYLLVEREGFLFIYFEAKDLDLGVSILPIAGHL